MAEINLLGYQGNAALGQGSNPQIPVFSPDENLNFVNQTLRDVMSRDAQKNIMLYQQRIADRDALTNQLINNQVSFKNINPEYQPFYDSAKGEVEKNYLAWGGDYNDTNGFRKYQDSVQNLKDITAQLQARTIGLKGLQAERAKQTLPSKQALFDKQIAKEREKEKQKGGIWSPVDPVQQIFSASLDPFQKVAVEQVRDNVDPATGIGVKETFYDWNNALKNGQLMALDPEDGENIRQTITMFEDAPPDQLSSLIDGFNKNLDVFNKSRGIIDPANPNYIRFKPLVQDPQTGRLHLNESPAEFAAKLSLATKDAFGSSTPTINKDFAKLANDKAELDLKRQKLALDAQKLGIDRAKAGAYIRSANANADKIRASLEAQATTIEPQYQKFIQAIVPGSVSVSRNIFKGGNLFSSSKEGAIDRIPTTSLTAGDQFINGPVVDSKGKISVGRLVPFTTTDKKRSSYYVPRYVDPVSGSVITLGKLPPEIQAALDIKNRDRVKADKISKEEYVKSLLRNNVLDLIVEGQNGSVNYSDMLKSAKTLNAQVTTKGEENINPEVPENLPATE